MQLSRLTSACVSPKMLVCTDAHKNLWLASNSIDAAGAGAEAPVLSMSGKLNSEGDGWQVRVSCFGESRTHTIPWCKARFVRSMDR